MISLEEARRLVEQRTRPLPSSPVELSAALGRVLAADVVSDIDSPPWDKALVDGYAVRSADFSGEDPVELMVLEEVTAGRAPSLPLAPGHATRIMTGAPLPEGCDAVVMIEQSEAAHGRVVLRGGARTEQNLLRRGASVRRGDRVVRRGAELRFVEIGVLAEAGCARPPVHRAPRVAVISTGDELVPPERTPAVGQIRNSNGPMLEAQVRQGGADPRPLGIAADEPKVLREQIERGLQSDVLLLSGGVSAGVLDLVPAALQSCGVEEVFHKVLLKPGKPVWFGQSAAGTLVFGLPGNPVGSLVCFEQFVRPALRGLAGAAGAFEPRTFRARLAEEFMHRGRRPTFFPAFWEVDDRDAKAVTPLAWKGSADLRTLSDANCLIAFPPGDLLHQAGAEMTCWPLS